MTYIGLNDIIDYIKSIVRSFFVFCFKKMQVNFIFKKNIDCNLSDKNYADMLAFVNLFETMFKPAFVSEPHWNLRCHLDGFFSAQVNLCWLESNTTNQVIRTAYANKIKFPLNLIRLRQFEMDAERYLKRNYKTAYLPSTDSLKNQALLDGKECLNILSTKLGNNTFMFENQ